MYYQITDALVCTNTQPRPYTHYHVQCMCSVHSFPQKRMYSVCHNTYSGNTACPKALCDYGRYIYIYIHQEYFHRWKCSWLSLKDNRTVNEQDRRLNPSCSWSDHPLPSKQPQFFEADSLWRIFPTRLFSTSWRTNRRPPGILLTLRVIPERFHSAEIRDLSHPRGDCPAAAYIQGPAPLLPGGIS